MSEDVTEAQERDEEELNLRDTWRRMVRVYGTILQMAWDVARGRLTALLACMVILGLTGATQALFGKFVIDAIGVAAATTAIRWGIAFLAVVVISTLVQDALALLQFDMGDRISQEVDHRLMKVVTGAPGLDHLERPEFADKIKLVRDHTYVPFAALANVNAIMYIVFGLGAAVLLLGFIHPLLILMPLVAVPSGMLQFKVMRKHFKRFDEVAPEDRLAQHYLDLATEIKSAKEVRLFGIGRELERRYKELTDGYIRKLFRDRLKRSAVGIASGAMYGTTLAIAIGFIGWLALQGRASLGDVYMGVVITRQAIGHVEMAATMVAWLAELSFVGERYLWMFDYTPEVKVLTPGDPVPPPLAVFHGITLEDVGFTYPGTEEKVLERVSLHIPAAGTVALVGENGAGKSTIVKLLSRFYDPTEGRIMVDGVDLRAMDPDDWREVLAASFQDFVKFQLVAQEAVGVGDLAAIEDLPRVTSASEFAGADRVIENLPRSFETQLGREFEEGIDLSDGEWQRVALARGAMRSSPVLVILDEPTAALDARAEHEVFERFARMARPDDAFHPITLLVSHRFSTVRMADLIVVLHEGRIEEFGSHEELLARGGRYSELFRLQASRYD